MGSVCIFHGNLNHVKSWFEIAKSRDHVKFRDVDPLPHGSNDKVWMVKEFKQTGRERTPSLTCFHIPSRNMPFNGVSQQPTRPRFLGLRLRLRPDPCLVETRDWDWDLKVSEVETETETAHFWSRPRLILRLAHGFISKSGATNFQVEMKFSWLHCLKHF